MKSLRMLIVISSCISADETHALKKHMDDQAFMEILVSKMETSLFKDSKGQLLDVCEWHGIRCDERNMVRKIEWIEEFKSNQLILLDWLPSKTQKVEVPCNSLMGVIPFEALPHDLRILDVSGNAFSGSADLTALPRKMRELRISKNKISGSLALQGVSCHLRVLDIHDNLFEGALDLTILPFDRIGFDVGLSYRAISEGTLMLDATLNSFNKINISSYEQYENLDIFAQNLCYHVTDQNSNVFPIRKERKACTCG